MYSSSIISTKRFNPTRIVLIVAKLLNSSITCIINLKEKNSLCKTLCWQLIVSVDRNVVTSIKWQARLLRLICIKGKKKGSDFFFWKRCFKKMHNLYITSNKGNLYLFFINFSFLQLTCSSRTWSTCLFSFSTLSIYTEFFFLFHRFLYIKNMYWK